MQNEKVDRIILFIFNFSFSFISFIIIFFGVSFFLFLMERKFWSACSTRDLETASIIFKTVPHLNINYRESKCNDWTPLHYACSRGHSVIVAFLLSLDNILINVGDDTGWTPLICAVKHNCVDVVVRLLKDPRCDVNLYTQDNYRPIHLATVHNYPRTIEAFVASGRDFIMPETGDIKDDPVAVAKGRGNNTMALLLEQFRINPEPTVRKMRIDFGWYDRSAADLLALVNFHCNGLLKLKGEPDRSELQKHSRFFKIVRQLPTEIQMIICRRSVYSVKCVITERRTTGALKELAWKLVYL